MVQRREVASPQSASPGVHLLVRIPQALQKSLVALSERLQLRWVDSSTGLIEHRECVTHRWVNQLAYQQVVYQTDILRFTFTGKNLQQGKPVPVIGAKGLNIRPVLPGWEENCPSVLRALRWREIAAHPEARFFEKTAIRSRKRYKTTKGDISIEEGDILTEL